MIGLEYSIKANRTEKKRGRVTETEVKEKEGRQLVDGRRRWDEQAILSLSGSTYSIHNIQIVVPAASEGSLDFLAVLPGVSILSM